MSDPQPDPVPAPDARLKAAATGVCDAPDPDDNHACDLTAGHPGQHDELEYGRLHTWPAETPAGGEQA